MHSSKSKAKGISASSFFDLKAELSKQEQEFAKNKAAGKTTIIGGVHRPDKKPTVWARQNKGVKGRASRDTELEAISKPTLESARTALERKAKIYDKLKKGKTGGLTDKQYDGLLVDFDNKPGSDDWESDSEDLDESVAVARPPTDDDPMVEYEDEFGRLRTARRSEVPRNLIPQEEEPDEDEDIIIRNPVDHFPIYEQTEERLAEIAKALAEEDNPLGVHYDASREVRAKGAGFYQFSTDETTRQAQMENLKAARDETGKAREEAGAVDIRPGEVEGMQGGSSASKSRAVEKRKREIEDRRKLVEAKRRKLKGGDSTSSAPPPEEPAVFVASVPDPFVALEAQAKPVTQEKGKAKAKESLNEADVFLAQLEQDIIRKRGAK
ncbi:hypothetical protein C8J56DRAFT_779666 [Mycena floridula]|nr:hypothetical protein C8J56DRAFT_779666 [Mycena floridula]